MTEFPPELAEALNRAGMEALRVAGDDDARVLIYAEIGEELDHAIFRYARPGDERLRCASEYLDVLDALREAWEISSAMGRKFRWRAIVYRVENRQMQVELLYPGDVDENLSMYDKEDLLLARHFPGMEVEPQEDLPGSFTPSFAPRRPFWKFWRS